MDKNIKEYQEKQKNVLYFHDECGNRIAKLTRDITDNNYEYLNLIAVDNVEGKEKDYDWYTGIWYNPNKKKPKDPKKPKGTGGKEPYMLIMQNRLIDLRKELRDKGIKNVEEIIGYLFILSQYIQWSTGKLVKKKRSKKPLQYNDMVEIFDCSKPKLNKIISVLKDNNLLSHTKDGYFISTNYIKKGKSQL